MLRLILLPLLVLSASAFVLERNSCKHAGFYTLIDNTPAFYGCYPNKAGGFTLKHLTCPEEQVFSAAVGHCVHSLKLKSLAEASTTSEEPSESTTTSEKPTEKTTPTEEPTKETTPTEEPTKDTTTTEKPTESTTTSEEPAKDTTPTEEPTKDTTTSEEPTETTSSTDETSKGTTTEEPENTTEPGTTENPNETTTPRPFVCPTSGFFPTNGACNKFVYCMSNAENPKPIELTCPENQEFNPQTLFCEQNYKCDADDIKTNHQLDFHCIMEGIFPDDKDHSKYFVCTWNEKAKAFKYEHRICPETEVFHKLTGRCGRNI